jgi:hypothetical protein
MGRISSSIEPDLFSTAVARDRSPHDHAAPSRPPRITAKPTPATPYVLPSDPPKALSQLQDQEFDRLVDAVRAEQKRRGGKLDMSDTIPLKQRSESSHAGLTSSKLNAVRAAFKAGVKPTQIARQFGITQADVRKALAADASRA